MFVATNLPPGRNCKSPLLRSGDLFGLTEVTSNFGVEVFSVCDCASPMDATSAIPIRFRFMAFLLPASPRCFSNPNSLNFPTLMSSGR